MVLTLKVISRLVSAAMEDFKTNQQGAQNAYNSAERQFGLTNADINRQKVIDKANTDLRKREYQASIEFC